MLSSVGGWGVGVEKKMGSSCGGQREGVKIRVNGITGRGVGGGEGEMGSCGGEKWQPMMISWWSKLKLIPL